MRRIVVATVVAAALVLAGCGGGGSGDRSSADQTQAGGAIPDKETGAPQTGAGVFISNGMVGTQTLLPMPAPCTAVNASYVLAAGVEAKFLGKEFEIARKAIVDKRWNYQVPQDGRCNRAP